MSIQLALFDLDGTLIDTAPDMIAALNKQLDHHQRPNVDFNWARQYVSKGGVGMIRCGFADIDDTDSIETLRQEYLQLYSEQLSEHSALFPGIQTVLDYLQTEGIDWGIVTNKPGWLAQPLVQQLGLSPACLVCGDTLETRKPHPGPILYACEQLGITISAAVYFGDDLRDVQSAHDAGMPVAVMNYGYITEAIPPLHWQADAYLDKAEEIIEFIQHQSITT